MPSKTWPEGDFLVSHGSATVRVDTCDLETVRQDLTLSESVVSLPGGGFGTWRNSEGTA